MVVRGKNINLYLMDGTATGRIKCTLANWTGVAYKIPRTDMDKCKERDDLKQSGVYFLFGGSDMTDDKKLYISDKPERVKMARAFFTVCRSINVIRRKITGQRQWCLLHQTTRSVLLR